MEYEILEDSQEEVKNPKFKDLLKEYKELDIKIKEAKLKQDKLKIEIFNLMEDEEIKKFSNDFGTAYYTDRFTYNKKEAIEFFKENAPENLITEYKVKPDVEIRIRFEEEFDFNKKVTKSKAIRTK